ncbi:N,N-dimethylformamidase beta subunit family domain-containing protein [Streptomyces hirsutus]|uniref:N,N-dimethylformamidase beta subunit family domain-containing protein n=1 Tax=Streptomyces hirsutus TaxID=35620 RepID=UPI0033F40527
MGAQQGHCRIEGFSSTGGVAPGEAIDFHVTVDPPQEFRVDVHRVGHYDGRGAARIMSGPRLAGIAQPSPLTADRTVSCHHWWLSWRLAVPSDWSVGAYVAVLTTADGRNRARIPFTVRDHRPADLLLVLPDITWQLHNRYPKDDGTGGARAADGILHQCGDGDESGDGDGRPPGEAGTDPLSDLAAHSHSAATVSFDRPYAGAGLPPSAGHAYDVIRWAERYGYDLAYADAGDLHAGRVDPTRYRGLLFPGPDAYWSRAMRGTAEHAREYGTSLVFLSARTMYGQVELAPSPSGVPDRLLTCRSGRRRGPDRRAQDRRAQDRGAPGRAEPGRAALWREADRAEQQLIGVQYAGQVPEPHPLIVRNAGHWLWEATGAFEGDAIEGLVAVGADRYFPRTPLPEHEERVLLAHSPYTDGAGAGRHQETSLYRAPSGAWVFASGTLAWPPALGRPGRTDPRVQRATANLLDRICKND